MSMSGFSGIFLGDGPAFFLLVFAALVVLALVWVFFLRRVECPHCSESFSVNKMEERWDGEIRHSCCPHCGQPIWSRERAFFG